MEENERQVGKFKFEFDHSSENFEESFGLDVGFELKKFTYIAEKAGMRKSQIFEELLLKCESLMDVVRVAYFFGKVVGFARGLDRITGQTSERG